VEETKLLAGDGAAHDLFGHSVSISGDTIVVGSPYDDTSVNNISIANTGSAYVYDLNEPPTADAGGPYSGDKDAAIALDGATASDPESDPLTYAWTGGGEGCTFTDVGVLNPALTCAEAGSYTVTLSVTDRYGEKASDTAEVTVTARVDEAPSKPGTPELTSGGNPNGSGSFTLGWAASTDPEGAAVTYRLEHKDADDAEFSPLAEAVSTNSYAVTEGEGTWVYRVRASDGNLESETSEVSSPVVVDKTPPTPPTVSFSASPIGGWYKGSVTVSYAGSTDPALADGSAGSGVASYSPAQTFSSSGAHPYSGAATDAAGNASAAVTGSVDVDADPPEVSITCPDTVILGSSASAPWTASDGESGLATAPSGSVTLDTGAVGSKTATAPTATDNVGYESSASCDYRVIYDFSGFFQPVNNPPTLNSVKAGQAVPVKFSLSGDQGLAIFAPSYPKSQEVPCSSTAPVDGIEETVSAGGSSLSYDASSDRYTYVWKTDKAWAGSCRQLVLEFDDGQRQRATFRFVK